MMHRRKIIVRIVTIATIAALMLLTVKALEVNRLINRVDEEIASTKKELEKEQEKIAAMKAEIEQIDSPEYIEKVAREKLGMVKEEDIVFKERPKP